ncbi:MAG TPA: hypothetical protein VF546_07205 [Pyrinomonadaceae bacterium]|jgi:hypothetical protein
MPKQSSSYQSEAKGDQPSAEPPQAAASGSQPGAEPPQSASAAGGSEAQPTEYPPSAGGGALGASEPSIKPPTAGAEEGITAWQNNKRITALWVIGENRNSWVYIAGVGWKKLANNDDTAVVALTKVSASALQTQTQVNYRDEADGMIHEIYVW